MPLIISTLGKETYCKYILIITTATIPTLFCIKTGPLYFEKLVTAYLHQDSQLIRKLVLECTTLIALMTTAIGFISFLAFFTFASPMLNEDWEKADSTITFLIVLVANLGSVVASPLEEAQSACHMQYRLHLRTLISYSITLSSLPFILPNFPSMACVAAFSFGTQLITKLINAAFYWKSLGPGLPRFHNNFFNQWPIIKDGFLYTISTGLSVYLGNQLPILIFSTLAPTSVSQDAIIVVQTALTIAGLGPFIISPFTPYLRHLKSARIPERARKIRNKISLMYIVLSVALLLPPLVAPNSFFRILQDSGIPLTQSTFLLTSILASALLWENKSFTFAAINCSNRNAIYRTISVRSVVILTLSCISTLLLTPKVSIFVACITLPILASALVLRCFELSAESEIPE